MATLYFNDDNTGDGDWNNVSNWWTNSGATNQASGKPTSSDSVVLQRNVTANGGSTPTVVDLTAPTGNTLLQITTIVTGTATFQGSARLNATLTGNCVFQDSAWSQSSAEITGNVTFNDNAYADTSTIHGNVTYNGSSYMLNGVVDTGNATFNGSSKYIRPLNSGQISTNATFNGSSKCCGQVNGLATFNGSAVALAGTLEGSEVSDCYLAGDAVFNGSSVFNGSASSTSTITMRDTSRADWYAGMYGWPSTGAINFYNSSGAIGGGGPWSPKPTFSNANYYDNSSSWYTAETAISTFYDNSYNITGHLSVIAKHGRGINGSSVLGFV
jgi:hypothetical protein